MIAVEDLTRVFQDRDAAPKRALDRVTLRVARAEVMGLLGPNGAGKTTLFRVIAGLLRPDGGRASVAGYDVVSQPLEARARLGLLTEDPCLPERLTPLWHVALHASLRGLARDEALERARRLLQTMGLGEAMNQPHARLSRGTRSKVALARALVHEPPALLLDEPTASLDMETTAWVREVIRRRARDGCAVLMATHDPVLAERLCDEVVILARGRVLARGALDDVRRPEEPSLEQAYHRIQREAS